MASLHHNAIKQKYKHIFTQFSKIAKCSFGPKIKLRYGQCDFVTYLKIGKYEFRDVKVMGIHLIFEWPKSVMAQDRKMVTKFSFKIIAKNGRHFSRDIEMNITSSNKSTGFDSFLPMCELNGDYFLENDQLTVEVEGIVEPPSIIVSIEIALA